VNSIRSIAGRVPQPSSIADRPRRADTAPYRTSDAIVSGWHFGGFEDVQAATSDSAFADAVKQDDNCAAVGTGKAANKDDLKRI
jgi:hypothetical protein